MTTLLILTLVLVLAAEFVNGWTDAPNAIATAVGTGVMTPASAIVMAVVLNALGTMAGTAVASTIGKGIVDPSFVTLPTICAAMLTVVIWGSIAATFGFPTSKSHALIAGLAGAGLAAGWFDALLLSGWKLIGIGLLLSLLVGFGGSYVITKLTMLVARNARPVPTRRTFNVLQIIAAAAMAFTHGLNDGQKFVGIFTLVLVTGGILPKFHIEVWVIVLCALTMGLGTACGGWKIVYTVAKKMVKIEPWQGFTSNATAAGVIALASNFGIPLSTTHTVTAGIAGACAGKRFSDLRTGVLGRIALAWIFTFPGCGLLSYAFASIALWLSH